jgi:hypothetical protein
MIGYEIKASDYNVQADISNIDQQISNAIAEERRLKDKYYAEEERIAELMKEMEAKKEENKQYEE